MVDSFLLRTFREDFPLNRGVAAGVTGKALVPLPNPNLDAVDVAGFVSGKDLETGEGPRMLGRVRPVCCGLWADVAPVLDSENPEMCAISASLFSILGAAAGCCMYVPILLVRVASPGRVGGSNPALYDAMITG